MGYREVPMLEIKEVLRLWCAGVAKRRIAVQLGLDIKTVRRYLREAQKCGVWPAGEGPLGEGQVAGVVAAAEPDWGRQRGEDWAVCAGQRAFIASPLRARVRLTKIRKLLKGHGVEVAYPTLRRFAIVELDFGRSAATIPLADGKPGDELQVDTGWMTYLEPDASGKRRRMRAGIFTPAGSPYRFVHPAPGEPTP